MVSQGRLIDDTTATTGETSQLNRMHKEEPTLIASGLRGIQAEAHDRP